MFFSEVIPQIYSNFLPEKNKCDECIKCDDVATEYWSS